MSKKPSQLFLLPSKAPYFLYTSRGREGYRFQAYSNTLNESYINQYLQKGIVYQGWIIENQIAAHSRIVPNPVNPHEKAMAITRVSIYGVDISERFKSWGIGAILSQEILDLVQGDYLGLLRTFKPDEKITGKGTLPNVTLVYEPLNFNKKSLAVLNNGTYDLHKISKILKSILSGYVKQKPIVFIVPNTIYTPTQKGTNYYDNFWNFNNAIRQLLFLLFPKKDRKNITVNYFLEMESFELNTIKEHNFNFLPKKYLAIFKSEINVNEIVLIDITTGEIISSVPESPVVARWVDLLTNKKYDLNTMEILSLSKEMDAHGISILNISNNAHSINQSNDVRNNESIIEINKRLEELIELFTYRIKRIKNKNPENVLKEITLIFKFLLEQNTNPLPLELVQKYEKELHHLLLYEAYKQIPVFWESIKEVFIAVSNKKETDQKTENIFGKSIIQLIHDYSQINPSFKPDCTEFFWTLTFGYFTLQEKTIEGTIKQLNEPFKYEIKRIISPLSTEALANPFIDHDSIIKSFALFLDQVYNEKESPLHSYKNHNIFKYKVNQYFSSLLSLKRKEILEKTDKNHEKIYSYFEKIYLTIFTFYPELIEKEILIKSTKKLTALYHETKQPITKLIGFISVFYEKIKLKTQENANALTLEIIDTIKSVSPLSAIQTALELAESYKQAEFVIKALQVLRETMNTTQLPFEHYNQAIIKSNQLLIQLNVEPRIIIKNITASIEKGVIYVNIFTTLATIAEQWASNLTKIKTRSVNTDTEINTNKLIENGLNGLKIWLQNQLTSQKYVQREKLENIGKILRIYLEIILEILNEKTPQLQYLLKSSIIREIFEFEKQYEELKPKTLPSLNFEASFNLSQEFQVIEIQPEIIIAKIELFAIQKQQLEELVKLTEQFVESIKKVTETRDIPFEKEELLIQLIKKYFEMLETIQKKQPLITLYLLNSILELFKFGNIYEQLTTNYSELIQNILVNNKIYFKQKAKAKNQFPIKELWSYSQKIISNIIKLQVLKTHEIINLLLIYSREVLESEKFDPELWFSIYKFILETQISQNYYEKEILHEFSDQIETIFNKIPPPLPFTFQQFYNETVQIIPELKRKAVQYNNDPSVIESITELYNRNINYALILVLLETSSRRIPNDLIQHLNQFNQTQLQQTINTIKEYYHKQKDTILAKYPDKHIINSLMIIFNEFVLNKNIQYKRLNNEKIYEIKDLAWDSLFEIITSFGKNVTTTSFIQEVKSTLLKSVNKLSTSEAKKLLSKLLSEILSLKSPGEILWEYIYELIQNNLTARFIPDIIDKQSMLAVLKETLKGETQIVWSTLIKFTDFPALFYDPETITSYLEALHSIITYLDNELTTIKELRKSKKIDNKEYEDKFKAAITYIKSLEQLNIKKILNKNTEQSILIAILLLENSQTVKNLEYKTFYVYESLQIIASIPHVIEFFKLQTNASHADGNITTLLEKWINELNQQINEITKLFISYLKTKTLLLLSLDKSINQMAKLIQFSFQPTIQPDKQSQFTELYISAALLSLLYITYYYRLKKSENKDTLQNRFQITFGKIKQTFQKVILTSHVATSQKFLSKSIISLNTKIFESSMGILLIIPNDLITLLLNTILDLGSFEEKLKLFLDFFYAVSVSFPIPQLHLKILETINERIHNFKFLDEEMKRTTKSFKVQYSNRLMIQSLYVEKVLQKILELIISPEFIANEKKLVKKHLISQIIEKYIIPNNKNYLKLLQKYNEQITYLRYNRTVVKDLVMEKQYFYSLLNNVYLLYSAITLIEKFKHQTIIDEKEYGEILKTLNQGTYPDNKKNTSKHDVYKFLNHLAQITKNTEIRENVSSMLEKYGSLIPTVSPNKDLKSYLNQEKQILNTFNLLKQIYDVI